MSKKPKIKANASLIKEIKSMSKAEYVASLKAQQPKKKVIWERIIIQRKEEFKTKDGIFHKGITEIDETGFKPSKKYITDTDPDIELKCLVESLNEYLSFYEKFLQQ